jgi:transcriptional regulator with XRE-family HTH domain
MHEPFVSYKNFLCLSADFSKALSNRGLRGRFVSSRNRSMRFRWSVGEVVAKLRESEGLTQVALAAKSHASRSAIARLEKGNANTTARTMERVAAGLGVSPGQILRLRERFERLSGLSWLDDLSDAQIEKLRQMVQEIATPPPQESPEATTEAGDEAHEATRRARGGSTT